VSERKRQILKESGKTVEYVYGENIENYVMVQSSVVRRKLCNPGYLGESIEGSELAPRVVGYKQASGVEDSVVLGVKPVLAQNHIRSISCGSQSVSSAVVVSDIVPVVPKFVPVALISFPELVSILNLLILKLVVLLQHPQLRLYLIVVDVPRMLKIKKNSNIVIKKLLLFPLLVKE